MENNEYWIETFTGKRIDPFHLDEELIDINDIAHSLSLLCRFTGHCSRFYSVAEHSVKVANLVYDNMLDVVDDKGTVHKSARAALLHDATEAYIGDISRPVKHYPDLKFIKELEQQIMGKIGHKFHLAGANWNLIKRADDTLLSTEALALMPSKGKGWDLPEMPLLDLSILEPEDIEPLFLTMFEEYGGKY